MAESEEPKKGEPWAALIFGLMFLGGSVWAYLDLTRFEEEGGQREVHWLFAWLYNNLGKWGLVGFLALIGLGAIVHGIVMLATRGRTTGRGARPARRPRRRRAEDD